MTSLCDRLPALGRGVHSKKDLTLLLAGLVLATSGCLRLKQTAVSTSDSPAQKMLDTSDHREVLDVPEATEPSAHFVLEGKPFCFAGSNNYYVTYKSRRMVDDVLTSARDMKLKVMRCWGYIDRGSLDGRVPHRNGDGTQDGVYFQYWDTHNQRPAYNENPDTGLPRLDYVLHKARQLSLRITLVLTNNWKDFGGMDQYLLWYGLAKHHEFYTDPRVKQAYKDWARHLIERVNTIDGVPYVEDPAIFAWELANEPRTRNYEEYDAPGWTKDTITDWAKEMSAHVKSLDPNHMVAVGDEGLMTRPGGPSFYDGADGVDHEALLGLPQVDFGTFHLYPDHWGQGLRFGNQWVSDHIVAARKAGKPTVLEEYGVVIQRDEQQAIVGGWDRREVAYRNWNELMLKQGGAGSMFWLLSGIDDTKGLYPDYDTFTVYRGDRTHQLLSSYIERFATQAQACKYPAAELGPASPIVRAVRLVKVAALDRDRILAAVGGSR